MSYTSADIQAISALGHDPENWVRGGQQETEIADNAAQTIQDSYTENDWRYVLNALSPKRAARKIANRPPSERHHLLSLLDPHQRSEVESHLALTV